MSNKNGFDDMASHFGQLSKVDMKKITLNSLEAAADYYVAKLLPVIPKSLLKKKHARDHVVISVEKEKVVVRFEDTSFYWRFVENGTVKIKAQHFARRSWETNRSEIEKIMTKKILKELE